VGETCKTCFAYHQVDQPLAAKGEPITICGIEEGHNSDLNEYGHTYLQRGTRKVHETKDPDCPGCKRGDCTLYEDTEEERDIPNYPRPATTMKGSAMTQQQRDKIKREAARRNQLARLGMTNDAGNQGAAGRIAPRPRTRPEDGRAPAQVAGGGTAPE